MMKSNNKEVKNRIRNYILDGLDFSGYCGYEGYPAEEPETVNDKILLCRDIFRKEYGHNIRRMGSEREAFIGWLCGLPSALTVDCDFYSVRKIVAGWMDQTLVQSSRFSNDEVWERFLQLLAREFFEMVQTAEKSNKDRK